MDTRFRIEDLRRDYRAAALLEADVSANAIDQFAHWLAQAVIAQIPEPNAMIAATVDVSGRPHARTVLLKGYSQKGFVFYTNFESDKAKELQANPFIALCFNWLDLERQIRIEGHASQLDESVATEYFQSRPTGSQLGAWASPQSRVVPDRQWLEDHYEATEKQLGDQTPYPKPDFWGGFLVVPDRIEFWQGRTGRLHDRINYRLDADNQWKIERLAP